MRSVWYILTVTFIALACWRLLNHDYYPNGYLHHQSLTHSALDVPYHSSSIFDDSFEQVSHEFIEQEARVARYAKILNGLDHAPLNAGEGRDGDIAAEAVAKYYADVIGEDAESVRLRRLHGWLE